MAETVEVKHTIETEKKPDGTVVRTEKIVTTASSQAVLDEHLLSRSTGREARGRSLWDFFGPIRP